MKRKCEECKLENVFFRMKEHPTVIYCDLCGHEVKVSKQEASWYDEDNTGDSD